MKKLNKVFLFLVYILPAVLFFSYYPIISLGSNDSMNFELSLPLLWLVIFDFVGAILIIKRKLLKGILRLWPWLLLPGFLTLSIIWSMNTTRGILTVGILWLIYFVGFLVFKLKDLIKTKNFYKWFFVATLAICFWCFLQCILDVIGVSREHSLMCVGCVSQMFGFPHPNGFAVEPQFMGNLLLAPTITAAWLYMIKCPNSLLKSSKLILFCFFVFVATLFLTFSRGAIYAFAVAIVVMSGVLIVRKKWKNTGKRLAILWGAMVFAFLIILNLQGIFTEIGPTDETYRSGVAKSLNHLSLGIIDIRENNQEDLIDLENNSISDSETEAEKGAVFDGYVESSTTIRVSLNDAAIEIWSKNAKTVLLGVGLGGAGEALYENGKTPNPKEIIHNQYFSLLLETGLVGIGLFVFTILIIIRATIKNKSRLLILTLIIAYAITLCFFAGLPNALQIYLLPIILFHIGKS